MDEMGGYDGWQYFYLIVPKNDPEDFRLHFIDNQYLARKYMLRDYLEDLFMYTMFELKE